MATTINLPEGFVLDENPQGINLPEGFVLDTQPTRVESTRTNQPFLPKRQAVEEQISRRPDSVEMLKERIKPPSNLSELLNFLTMNPVQRMISAGQTGATALSVPYQRGEAAIAAPALEAQAGNFNLSDLARAAVEGLTGQRPAQLGDVIRTTGFGGRLNEPLAAISGLGGMSALTGGAIRAGQKMAPVIKGVGQKVGQGVGEIINKPIRFVKNIAKRSTANYITDDVAPQAHAIYQDSIKKFTPQIQQFAKEELKIPETAIKTISKNGVDDVMTTAEKYGNSTDPIYQKIQDGIQGKDMAVNEAYKQAFSGVSNKTPIPMNRTYRAMSGLLKRTGYIDEVGNATTIGKSQSRNPTLGAILDYYESMNPSQSFNKIGLKSPASINKSQWILFRENLSRLQKQSGSQRKSVTSILNALHSDAESAGLKGIKNARALARANFQAEDNILTNSLIRERKLNNYQKFSMEERRQLKAIERFIGEPFVDDLDKLTAAQELQKFNKYNLGNFQRELSEAVDPKWTMTRYKEYKALLGEKNAMDIFREVIAHRKAVFAKKIAVGSAITGGSLAVGGRALVRKLLD